MADLKISQLASATTPLAGTEVLPIVQSSATVKTPVSALMGFGPVFRAYQNSSISISNATSTTLPLNTEQYDTNSNYDPATYRFTPTIAGYYQVNGVANYFPVGGGNCFISVFKNGVEYSRGPFSPDVAPGLGVSDIIPMNGSTDYLDLRLFQASGVSQTYNPSVNLCYMSAGLIRTT